MVPTNSPYTTVHDITPADDDFDNGGYRGFYIEGAGNVRVTTSDGNDILFTSPTTKVWHPVCFKRIWSTNTTATGIKAGK